MKKLTIFVDMDGTIESLLDVWLERLNKKYNANIKYEDIKSWDISAAYEGLTQADVLDIIMDDSIWQDVKPIEGAPETLEKWILEGHNVYIVTATPYQSIKSKTENLLFRCFPYLSWENVIITSNKQLLKGDVMIDDGAHNLIGGDYKKILFDAPYNRIIDDKYENIIRVKSWMEIDEIIESIASA